MTAIKRWLPLVVGVALVTMLIITSAFAGEGTFEVRHQASTGVKHVAREHPVRKAVQLVSAEPEGIDVQALRRQIVDRGAYIANALGNGPYDSPRSGPQFFYGQTAVGYRNFEELDSNIEEMLLNKNKRCEISCAACATYCWQWAMKDVPNLYWRKCVLAVGESGLGAILEGDGTIDYIKSNGQPGDLLFFTADGDSYNAYAKCRYDGVNAHSVEGAWSHTELYIGHYKNDAQGSDMEYACVASNGSSQAWSIKPLGTHSGRKVYLCSLSKYLETCAPTIKGGS